MTIAVKTGAITSAVSASAVSSLTINKPAGLVAGDVLMCFITSQASTYTGTDVTKAWVPSVGGTGWTLPSKPNVYFNAQARISNFQYLLVTSANVGTLPASWTFTENTGTGRANGVIVPISGADQANLFGGVNWDNPATTQGSVASGSPVGKILSTYVGGITFDSGTPLLGIGVDYCQLTSGNVNGYSSARPNWTLVIESNTDATSTTSRTPLLVWSRRYNGTSPLNPEAQPMTWAATTLSSSFGNTIYVKELVAPTAGAGIPVRRVEAGPTLAAHRARIMQATGPQTPAHVRQVKPGATNVAALLAQTPLYYVAHRGSSLDWAEMSQYAYMRSSMYGVGAIEISLARTSDGVYFGLHDDSLDRTSLGVTGSTLVASTMTWAQVQAYDIIPPSGTTHQPYMRWETFVAQYAKTHVIFVDPKFINFTYWNTILDMMDAAGGPTRFIGKYYGVEGGVGNTGWAKRCADRGYERWGYFYDADAANYAAYQGRWSLLGMSYDALQTYWDQILSYGKPVIGHICPTAAAASTALTKGAKGIMGSGITSIRAGADVIK